MKFFNTSISIDPRRRPADDPTMKPREAAPNPDFPFSK